MGTVEDGRRHFCTDLGGGDVYHATIADAADFRRFTSAKTEDRWTLRGRLVAIKTGRPDLG